MRVTKLCLKLACLITCIILPCTSYADENLLPVIKKRGYLKCGVSQGVPGFSSINDDGTWSGLDVDICRAIAAAIFKDDKHIRFIPLSTSERFTALESGEVDILSCNASWTLTRDAELGIIFTNIVYYDGQGFMVRKDSGYKKLADLKNVTICCNAGTTTELNTSDYFRFHNIPFNIITFEKQLEVIAAYDAGRCDVYTDDRSGLAAAKLRMRNPADNIILPETISKEPLGPAVREDDENWEDFVRWVIFGLLNAEENGITKANAAEMLNSNNPEIRRLLGIQVNFGKYFGVDKDFLYQALKITGNYGEIYERNLGEHSELNLPRELNNLWTKGGLMYGPPYR